MKTVFVDTDYNNVVFYECGKTNEDGLCDENGKYVSWWSRSLEEPSEELLQEVSTLMQTYCVQPGDMILHSLEDGKNALSFYPFACICRIVTENGICNADLFRNSR